MGKFEYFDFRNFFFVFRGYLFIIVNNYLYFVIFSAKRALSFKNLLKKKIKNYKFKFPIT